jgi:hypothetical protein
MARLASVTRHGRRRAFVAALLLLVFLPASALAPELGDRAALSEQVSAPPIVSGGTATERALLRRIAARTEAQTISRIALVPSRSLPSAPPRGVAIRFISHRAGTRAMWEEVLIASAFRDLAIKKGLSRIVYFDGSSSRFSLVGAMEVASSADLMKPETARVVRNTLVARARAAADAGGVELVEARVVGPLGPAIAVTVRTRETATFLRERLRHLTLPLHAESPRVDGVFLAVLDSEDKLVYSEFTASRVGRTQGSWVHPDFRGCVPPAFTSRPHPGDGTSDPGC